MLLRCCLIRISIIILRHFLYLLMSRPTTTYVGSMERRISIILFEFVNWKVTSFWVTQFRDSISKSRVPKLYFNKYSHNTDTMQTQKAKKYCIVNLDWLLGVHFEVVVVEWKGGEGVLKLPFIRDWPEIRKSEIPASEFCLIYGDWGELGIQNLAQTSLIKCQGYSFYCFWVPLPLPRQRLGLSCQN